MDALKFAIVAIGYVAYSWRSRENALVGGAFLLPFNQYLPSSGIPLLNVQTLILLLILAAVARPPSVPRASRARPVPPLGYWLFGLVVTIGYVVTLLTNDPLMEVSWIYNPEASFVVFKEYLFLVAIVTSAYALADTPDVVKKVFWAAAAAYGLESVFCFLEFVVLRGQVSGHLDTRNVAGAFLASAGAFAAGAFMALRGNPRRRWLLGSSLAAFVGVLGTNSRGGLVALGATLALATLLRNRPLFILLIVLALTYQLWMPSAMLARFDEGYGVEEASGGMVRATTAGQRLLYWKAGFRTLVHYPLGIGLGLFKVIVPQHGLWGELEGYVFKNAHNSFVMFIVEFGILGFLVLLGLQLLLARRALQVLRRAPDPLVRAAAFGGLVCLVALAAGSMFGNYFFRLDVAGIPWVLMAVLARTGAEMTAAERLPALARAA